MRKIYSSMLDGFPLPSCSIHPVYCGVRGEIYLPFPVDKQVTVVLVAIGVNILRYKRFFSIFFTSRKKEKHPFTVK